jgi:hydrogenase maturation protease
VHLVRDPLPAADRRPALSDERGDVIVIGLGNRARGDDAAGLEVVDRLGALLSGGPITLAAVEGDCLQLLELFDAARAVVLVDAMRCGAPPGTVHRIDAAVGPLSTASPGCSSHSVGAADAVELARVLGRLPAAAVVYGIEGACFDHREGLSEPVQGAIASLAARVAAEAEALALAA